GRDIPQGRRASDRRYPDGCHRRAARRGSRRSARDARRRRPSSVVEAIPAATRRRNLATRAVENHAPQAIAPRAPEALAGWKLYGGPHRPSCEHFSPANRRSLGECGQVVGRCQIPRLHRQSVTVQRIVAKAPELCLKYGVALIMPTDYDPIAAEYKRSKL